MTEHAAAIGLALLRKGGPAASRGAPEGGAPGPIGSRRGAVQDTGSG